MLGIYIWSRLYGRLRRTNMMLSAVAGLCIVCLSLFAINNNLPPQLLHIQEAFISTNSHPRLLRGLKGLEQTIPNEILRHALPGVTDHDSGPTT